MKITALVAGMLAGADSIDDMALLRHGGMKKLFAGAYAPSTLGSFLRAFTFGHTVVAAAHRAGAKVSITARMDPAVKRAIGTIADEV